MAEEKKSNTVKIRITEGKGWQLMSEHFPCGKVIEVDIQNYESMKNHVKHEVVK